MDESRAATPSRHRTVLIAIVTIGLLVRLGWGLTRPTDDISLQTLPDQNEYLQLARNLVNERSLSFYDERLEASVQAFRMPGYPFFLAACGANPLAARTAQAFIDAGTILAAYLLARRWLTPGQALLAALLVAVNPFLIYFPGLLLSETLFTAMLAWAMVLLTARGSPIERYRAGLTWVLGVALLALSIHVRPSAVALPLVLGIAAVFANRDPHAQRYQRRWPFPIGATTVVLTLAVLAPWAFRNQHVLGHWVWTTTNSGFTAYDGFNPDATGASDQRFVENMPHLKSMTEVERSQYLSTLAREYVADQPRRAIELAGRKIARTWSPVPLSEDFSRPLYVAVALAYSIPFDLLVLFGLWRTKGSGKAYDSIDTTATSLNDSVAATLPRNAKLFLLLPAVYLTVIHAISVGSLRYRIPAEVPMAVLAASAVAMVDRSRRQAPANEADPDASGGVEPRDRFESAV